MHMEYLVDTGTHLDTIYCPSCTEQIIAFVTTPPA